MNESVIICGKDGLRLQVILQKLAQVQDNTTVLPVYTTNEDCGYGYVNVSVSKFFDMVEEGKFFDYHEHDGAYYGTLHIQRDVTETGIFVMKNDVDVALDTKRFNKKVITIYVLPNEKEKSFKHPEVTTKDEYATAKQLDFLVVDSALDETVMKIQDIINFMKENMMRLKY